MSESERRRGYRYNRVLIETARILDPQFADAVVFLSGAQIEMLRNITQYLNRLETYVTEYNPGYYLAPTVADYDDILEIVADLEETLMGNPNTVWGYKERWSQREEQYGSGSNDVFISMTTVPEGELWVIEEAYVFHQSDSTTPTRLYLEGGGEYFYLFKYPSASPTVYHRWAGSLVLSEGDKAVAWVVSPGDGKHVQFSVWGHKMIVP